MTSGPDERLRKAAEHAENLRKAVVELLAADAAEAARIRRASDEILSVAEQIHKRSLPRRSQIENWPTSHIDETQQYMLDAVDAWRTAAVAHEHAVDMYDVAAETDREGLKADTKGLRNVADSLRAHTSRMKLIDKRYDNPAIQTSIYACNEAIGRINEKHTAIAARLNDTADKLVQAAAEYDTAPADRPRAIRQRPR